MLKQLSSACEFGEFWDTLIRNNIIGVWDKILKDCLLRESDLTHFSSIKLPS